MLLITIFVELQKVAAIFFIIKPTRRTNFPNLPGMKLYMFRAFPLPIVRSLFTVHLALIYVYRFENLCTFITNISRSSS